MRIDVADDDAAERDDGDLRRAAADVDDHAAAGLHDRQAGADRRGHRLLDEVGVARAGVERGVVDGALLDFGDAAGDADDTRGRGMPKPKRSCTERMK